MDAGSHRRVDVRIGGTDETHRRGGGVLLVVGMQDEQRLERADDIGIDLVLLLRRAEGQTQVVLHVAERVARVQEGGADG